MAEQPEIRIMSDYFNYFMKGKKIVKVEKNPDSKNKCDLSVITGKQWEASSLYRGKEMMVTLSSKEETHRLKIGFARIGALQIRELPKFSVYDL